MRIRLCAACVVVSLACVPLPSGATVIHDAAAEGEAVRAASFLRLHLANIVNGPYSTRVELSRRASRQKCDLIIDFGAFNILAYVPEPDRHVLLVDGTGFTLEHMSSTFMRGRSGYDARESLQLRFEVPVEAARRIKKAERVLYRCYTDYGSPLDMVIPPEGIKEWQEVIATGETQ